MSSLAHVFAVYMGSDGGATKALYERLEKLGPAGLIAVNLFRAQKNSERAKSYSGGIRGRGSYRGMAYDRKEWAMGNLTTALATHAAALSITWGWGIDENQEFHRHVLYVELPNGQVSFHTAERGEGPDAPRDWDGVRNASPQRVCRFAADVLDGEIAKQPPEQQEGSAAHG
jgi:hypothetical protein